MRLTPIGLALILMAGAAAPLAAQDMVDETHVAVAPEEITGDAAEGEKIFRRCAACHAVGEGAANKVGPVLNGVVGRLVASYPDFEYSDAMAALGEAGTYWTPAELDAYLINPREHVPGTKMVFQGLRNEADRANVIAYLATFPPPAAP